jgi:hypothetical protein
MRSNFDAELKVVGGVVQACGPLGWDAGETEAVVTVTITQKDKKLAGTASSPPSFAASDEEWMLEVQPAPAKQAFTTGPAHAVGVIHATGEDIPVRVFHWGQDVELTA